jgi:hypothetical protein
MDLAATLVQPPQNETRRRALEPLEQKRLYSVPWRAATGKEPGVFIISVFCNVKKHQSGQILTFSNNHN